MRVCMMTLGGVRRKSMVGEEENRREPSIWDGDVTENELGISSELPPPKVLLSRRDLGPWLFVAYGAAPLTLIAMVVYSRSSLPDQWGFYIAAWTRTGPLRIPTIGCALLVYILRRIVYGVPFGTPARRMLPEVLAYYPRTPRDRDRTSLALLHAALLLAKIYLVQMLIYTETWNFFFK